MLFGISFTARPGKEAELERVLHDEPASRLAAERMGASMDALFVQGNRFTRVWEFPDGQGDEAAVRARVLYAMAVPEFHAVLVRAGPLLQDPFDPEDPTTLAAFVQRHKMRPLLEVHPPPTLPAVDANGRAAFTRVAKTA
ncbi:MAG: hypothetical protein LC624_05310 [Halobacteriales archaeon]|nr:hypothetical protein [Halobacteriales archaeon]